MLEFLIYWITCAVCVAVAAVLVGYWQQRAITLLVTTETPPHFLRSFNRLLLIGWACIILFFLLPYIFVEIQTLLVCSWVYPLVKKAAEGTVGYSPQMYTLKVLRLTPTQVRCYVVLPCGVNRESNGTTKRMGVVYVFRKNDKAWILETEEGIWSECGSASGNVFPPYPDHD
jgi:hypothetical protein